MMTIKELMLMEVPVSDLEGGDCEDRNCSVYVINLLPNSLLPRKVIYYILRRFLVVLLVF